MTALPTSAPDLGRLAEGFRARAAGWSRRLGFRYVEETSVGAFHVAHETRLGAARGAAICTACPAVTRFVEEARPAQADALLPIVSPMVAHARLLRARHPEAQVVFVGPCVAKKAEADEAPELACALTFEELTEWLEREGIVLEHLEESAFDEEPGGAARLFPLPGGLARTAGLTASLLDEEVVPVSGLAALEEALDGLSAVHRPLLVEALFCAGGCLDGPAAGTKRPVFERRAELLAYARERGGRPDTSVAREVVVRPAFSRPPASGAEVTEEAVRHELEASGKARPEDRLDCGACGYPSCRDKAVAVLAGMAEREMCLPRMRRLAEQRTDRIIETSPNGILILDERLHILHMNPAFRRAFFCSDAVLGRPVSYLMDPAPFERLAAGTDELVEQTVRHDNYHLVCHELLYRLEAEHQYVGIFVNVTGMLTNRERLVELRQKTS